MSSEPTNSPTVFVVDDDDEMRASLAALIDTMGYPARCFASAAEFRRQYQQVDPGCLVLDIQMPRQTGLELYEQLLHEGKRLPVIFITAHADVTTAVAAMKTGAIEFLEKPFDRRMLLDRIEKALRLDAQWRSREQEFAEIERQMARLTTREAETLELIVQGESNKSMAAKLFISERAVEMRRSTLMKKLGVRSVSELLNLAVTHRLLADLRDAAEQRPFSSR